MSCGAVMVYLNHEHISAVNICSPVASSHLFSVGVRGASELLGEEKKHRVLQGNLHIYNDMTKDVLGM